MMLNEYESIAFNHEVKNDEIDKFIKMTNMNDVTSIAEAREKLFQSIKFIKKLKSTIENL